MWSIESELRDINVAITIRSSVYIEVHSSYCNRAEITQVLTVPRTSRVSSRHSLPSGELMTSAPSSIVKNRRLIQVSIIDSISFLHNIPPSYCPLSYLFAPLKFPLSALVRFLIPRFRIVQSGIVILYFRPRLLRGRFCHPRFRSANSKPHENNHVCE